MDESWKILFTKALAQLKQGKVATEHWVFGGGTVLTWKFGHRVSKDIDIFFNDAQLFNFISPRVNDAVEADLTDYVESAHHVRLYFKEGEVDFIIAAQISSMRPSIEDVLGTPVNVEHPVEIIAKKVHYRASEFKPRDMFDLAVVFNAQRECMLENAACFAEALPVLSRRIMDMQKDGTAEDILGNLAILPGGEDIRGREMGLCREFIKAIKQKLDETPFGGMIPSA